MGQKSLIGTGTKTDSCGLVPHTATSDEVS